MVDILVLDGRDERLRFLGLDGILTATCCPSCVGFLKGPAFNRFALDGGVEVFPSLTARRRRIAMSVPRSTRPSRKIPLCWAKRLCPCFTVRPVRM